MPFNVERAKRKVEVKVLSDRRSTAVIVIQQMDAGTAILEAAGRKTRNPLGTALGPLKPNRTRVLGPAVFSKKREIESEMRRLVRVTMDRVQREVG